MWCSRSQTFVNSPSLHLCQLTPGTVQTPSQHLKEWFTPVRRKLISSRALDALAERPLGTFSRFLAGQDKMTLERSGLGAYYPFLAEVGYTPPEPEPEPDPEP